MMKQIRTGILLCMLLGMLAGCGGNAAAPTVTTQPETTAPTTPTTLATTAPTEEYVYEGDASTYYTNEVFPEQIQRYYTALSQQWDAQRYSDKGLSQLAAFYHEGNPLDNVGFGFVDLDGDGIMELIIGAVQNAQADPIVFEIWTNTQDGPVMLAQSGAKNRYYLQYDPQENLWTVANEAENSAANLGVHYLTVEQGAFQVTQAVIFDALANPENPWFMAYDMDWDTANDTPIDEATAQSVMDANRQTYAPLELFPYCFY